MTMENGGYIRLFRQIMRWEWYKNTNTFRLFIHLLLRANYCDMSFEGRTIRRGQLVASLPSLARETSLTVQQVRTSLAHLKLTGEITDEPCRRYRIITVMKYNDYQADNSQNNSLSTGYQQADNRLSTGCQQQVNKVINKRNKKSNTTTTTRLPIQDYDQRDYSGEQDAAFGRMMARINARKTVPAQEYTQRDYTGDSEQHVQDMMNWDPEVDEA